MADDASNAPPQTAAAAAQGAPREIEIKFDVTEADLAPLEEALGGLGGRSRRRTLKTTYYDTPGQDLRKAGFFLRVREDGGAPVQTIKRDEASLFTRGEWEEAVGSAAPDLDAARKTPLGPALERSGPVQAQFVSLIDRTERAVNYQGAVIEVALDRGEVEAAGRSAPVHELELELKGGDPAGLFALAAALAQAADLHLSFETKAARGFRLAAGEAPAAVKGGPVRIKRGMTAGQAFAAIAADALRQVVANEKVLRERRRPQALHQMRVGLRRLRAALSLFKDVVADGDQAAIKAELKWVSGVLGETRNLDVFLAEAYGRSMGALRQEEGMAPLGRRLLRAQTQAYDRTVKALRSPRATALPLRLARWIEAGAWRDDTGLAQAREQPVQDLARRKLKRLRRRLARAGRLTGIAPEARHRLRIDAKKLRYGLDAFAGLYRAKQVARYVDALRRLQDDLGLLNDVAVARRLAPRLAGSDPTLRYAAGLVMGMRLGGEAACLAAADGHRRALVKARPPWRGT